MQSLEKLQPTEGESNCQHKACFFNLYIQNEFPRSIICSRPDKYLLYTQEISQDMFASIFLPFIIRAAVT